MVIMNKFIRKNRYFVFGFIQGTLGVATAQSEIIDKLISVPNLIKYIIAFAFWSLIFWAIFKVIAWNSK